MLLLPLLPISTTQVLQAVLFQCISFKRAKSIPVYKKDSVLLTEIIIAQYQSCQLYLNLLRGMWQNRISGTSLQTILFIETSRLIDHTIRVRLRS